jgi:hypothetical protein
MLAAPMPEAVAAIEIRPVGAAVGDVRNDGPRLVERVPVALLDGTVEQPQDLTLF